MQASTAAPLLPLPGTPPLTVSDDAGQALQRAQVGSDGQVHLLQPAATAMSLMNEWKCAHREYVVSVLLQCEVERGAVAHTRSIC
jgi:hypothetical protein